MVMAPAFSSTRQATAFALLLLVLLLLPVLAGSKFLPPREQTYAARDWTSGPYPWIRQQVFVEQGDIDVAFVGSSHMMWAIDTPYVQESLSTKLGRQATVRSVCWGGGGFDALYFITKDLLEHRRVKMLVFYDESQCTSGNAMASTWFRFGDDAGELTGLSWNYKARFYLASVVGMPRNLLGLLRSDLPADLFSSKPNYMQRAFHAPNPAARLGSVSGDNGTINPVPLAPYRPETAANPADVCVYAPAAASCFQISSQPMHPMDLFFASKFAALAREHGCRLVLLHIPLMHEVGSVTMQESQFFPKILQTDTTLIGIPPAKLFENLSREQVNRLYSSPEHFNKNGQEFFTALLTPALLRIYEDRSDP